MRAGWRGLSAAGLIALAGACRAQSAESGETTAAPVREDKVEGAIGLLLRYGAAYGGASDVKLKPTVGGFLRWGRFTVSGAGGFTTRRKDDVERGLSADLVRREDFRLGVAFRVASGRSESASPDLAGMGDIKSTLRAQLGARWRIAPGWAMSGTLNIDALNRAGGYFGDVSVSREWALVPGQRLVASVNLGAAGDRFMQVWHGVTREQSIASGYPEFHPSEGLRELGAALTWRVEFAERWAGYLTLAHTEWLGSVRRSPLTRDPSSQTLGGGLAWRF
jgi:MipA family protein